MYLKRLHLKGFKSFADATDILFKQGVNILVGPNGCGKSNVVDAMRWVLGSSRPKELRAQKQEDVIFNGAEGIRPQGMARVDMILDNEDGILPLEYSEVEVCRKLFRDGETEFQINQTRVRLKDIGELFNDTGIGKQGYAVIGQGEVETVLTGKPWERRMMIEEAAGLVHYRQEREEILRRLAQSQNNEMRLKDLFFELQERLERLKQKAEKARQHAELCIQRQQFMKQILTHEIMQRHEKLKNCNEQINRLEQQIADLNLEIQTVLEQETENGQSIEEIRAQEKTLYDQLETQEDSLHEQKTEAGILRERMYHFQQNAEQLNREIEQNQQQVERITPDIENSQKDYEESLQTIENDREQQKKQGEICQQLAVRMNLAQTKLTRDQQETLQEQDKLEKLALELEEKRRALVSLREEKKYLNLRFTEQQEQVNEEEKRYNELGLLLKQVQEQQKAYFDQRQQWEGKLSEKRCQYEEQKRQVSEHEELANRLKNQIQILQQMMENFSLHSESVRKLLFAIEHKDVYIPGLLGSVSELIETPQSLALAIETVLGGALDYLVTRSEHDASIGISYLKKAKGGRVTFLPLNNLRIQFMNKNVKNRILQYHEVIGIACDLVSCREEINPVVQYLLGRTVVVNCLEDGLKVFKEVRQPIRMVSLEGDVIHAGGTMTGGSRSSNQSGILARKARKKQLEEEWKEVRNILQESVQNFEQTEKAWQVFCQEGEALRQMQKESTFLVQNLTERFQQQEKKKQEIFEQKQQTEAAFQELGMSIQNLEKDVNDAEVTFQNHKEKVERMLDNSNLHQNDYIELQKEYELLTERLKVLQEQVEIKKQEAKTRESYWKQLENIRSSYLTTIHKTQEQLEKKGKEQQDLIENFEKLQSQMNLNEEMVHKQSLKLQQLRDVLKKMQKQEEEKQTILFPLRKQLGETRNMLHEKQLKKVRLETELENWQGKWEQELGEAWQMPLEIGEKISWEEIHKQQEKIREIDLQLQNIGEVDPGAIAEYEEVLNRYTFMGNQLDDLNHAHQKLMILLHETELHMDQQFHSFYEKLQQNFNRVFQHIFAGGQARLEMETASENQNLLNQGIDIVVQMPGKRVQNLPLLSGGEKTLVSIAFVFALLNLKNAPFCVMDEIDAPLDEANLTRFIEFVHKMAQETQFIIVSHRQAMIASGNIIYGITMAQKGVSKVLSLDLEQAVQMEQKSRPMSTR